MDCRAKRGTKTLVEGTKLRVHVEFRESEAAGEESVFGRAYTLYPTFEVSHGIGGHGGLDVSAGLYLPVCSNGMIVGNKSLTCKMRHTPGMLYRLENLEAVVDRAVRLIGKEQQFHQQARAVSLAGTEETRRALYYVLTGKAELPLPGARKVRGFDQLAHAHVFGDGADAGTAFGVLQAATHYATHDFGNDDRQLFNSVAPGALAIRSRARTLVSKAIDLRSMTGALLAV